MNASRIIAIALAVGATLWVASGMFAGEGDSATTDGPDGATASQPAEALPAVRVMTSTAQEHVDYLHLSGRTEAVIKVDIKAETAARVTEVAVEKGNRVEKGDVLIRLATEDRTARLERARALVEQRKLENDASESLAQKDYRSKTGVAESKALLEEARSDLKVIEVELANTVIRAPFSGLVEDRQAEIGDLVAVGDIVATVIDSDPILVVGHVPEHSIGMIEPGQLALAHLLDGTEREGMVRYTSRMSDAATRTFRVEIEIANPDYRIPDGMTAELQVPIGTKRAHQVPPSVLTLNDAGQLGVRGVVDDHVVFYPVDLQGGNRDSVWVGGLPDQIELIVVGHDWVREGVHVTISRLDPADVAKNPANAVAN
ncbi:MAG: efflux RND transporter periplasmic adaptor subunit [Pseudomonadota bacterium]